jgi:hypothetical protein
MPYRTAMKSYQEHKDVILDRNWVPAAYTFLGGSSGPVAADADGDRIIYAGQVVSVDSVTGKAYPHDANWEAQTPVGVLVEDVNLRYGDEASTVLIAGWVDENLCRDLGTFGAVTAGAKSALSGRVFFTMRGL